MVTSPLSVAVVGAGTQANHQLSALRSTGLVRSVSIWSRSPEPREALAHRYGAASFPSLDEMMEKTKPDLVTIVTPPGARVEILRRVIGAGAKAILIEKPIASTPHELESILAVGRSMFIAVNTQYRWIEHWARFRELIGQGGLGDVLAIRASTGVGLLDQGPHLVNVSLAVARAAGLPAPTWVASRPRSPRSDPHDANVILDLGTARLHLLAGNHAPRVVGEEVVHYQQQVDITGTAGQLWVSLNQGWRLRTARGHESGATIWNRDNVQAQASLFRDLAAAIDGPALQATFPTRLELVAEETRLLFECLTAGNPEQRHQIHPPIVWSSA